MAKVKVVIGSNYGDEGKGLATDYFCHQAISNGEKCLVICTNGGAQRGHTVETLEGERHVFHHFGSGTLVGADTYLCREFIINPMIFMQEYEELKKYKPKVYVNNWCRISTPYDMIANQIVEEKRGNNKHGSCGVGIWETINRSYAYFDSFNIIGLVSSQEETIRSEVLDIKSYYENEVFDVPDSWKSIWDSQALFDNYISDLYKMKSIIITSSEAKMINVLKEYDTFIMENGQGLLLDEKYGKHSTPTPTGIKIPRILIQGLSKILGNIDDVEYCYVTRSYLTRHGNGPFPEYCGKDKLGQIEDDQTNVYNKHQGTLRYGRLNYNELKKRIYDDSNISENVVSLFVTHINEVPFDVSMAMNDFDGVYVSNGKTRYSVRKVG